jgi:hypothetical protein
MKKLLFVMVLAFSFAGCVTTNWTQNNTNKELAYAVLHYADYRQTTAISKNSEDGFYEFNPILGKHPSNNRVNKYFLTTLILHPIISWSLPEDYRDSFQNITLVLKGGLVAHNLNLGLKITF